MSISKGESNLFLRWIISFERLCSVSFGNCVVKLFNICVPKTYWTADAYMFHYKFAVAVLSKKYYCLCSLSISIERKQRKNVRETNEFTSFTATYAWFEVWICYIILSLSLVNFYTVIVINIYVIYYVVYEHVYMYMLECFDFSRRVVIFFYLFTIFISTHRLK